MMAFPQFFFPVFVCCMQTDGFQTRCGNTKCAVGFQPEAGAALVLGDIIEPLSNPNGTKQTITIKLLKVPVNKIA